MDPIIYVLIFIGIATPFIVKHVLKDTITWWEMLAQCGILLIVGTVSTLLAIKASVLDTEILNGRVTGKEQDSVSCEHSYSCNCHWTGSGKNRHRSCSTCYEHSHDYDWILHSDVGDIEIDRIDRQGTHEPPRWTKAREGDPVAMPHSYDNWVKAVDYSLFHKGPVDEVVPGLVSDQEVLPAYPLRIYDYHYDDRVILDGVTLTDLPDWNKDLALRLRELGPKKQANLVIVITDALSPRYAARLEDAWLGGKKNDVVTVISLDTTAAEKKIRWVRSFGWSKNAMVYVSLRDSLMAVPSFDRKTVIETIASVVEKDYERMPMQEFEYLKSRVRLSTETRIGLLILTAIAWIATTWYFHHNQHRVSRPTFRKGY